MLDNKAGLAYVAQYPASRRRVVFGLTALIATLLASICYGFSSLDRSPVDRVNENVTHSDSFDWFSVKPGRKFEWTPCYSGHRCARVILPLDYETPEGPTVIIAVRMIPATARDNYRGTIFLNPGGPGGSGVEFVERMGANISTLVGPSFDVLSFDPRGIGRTTPSASCFDTASQRDIWYTQDGPRLINESLPISRARAKMLVERCEQRIGGEWGIGRFASSPYVARDMLEMTQLLGQEKLQYWGFSYGTLLGQYFATMYPDKIKRFVIDGVADAEFYRASYIETDIEDMETIVNSFFDFCYQAGPEKCVLYDTSPERIRSRYFGVLTELEQDPVPAYLAEPPLLITRKTLLNQLFRAVYKPIAQFPIVAETIRALETGNQTAITALVERVIKPATCSCESGQYTGSNEAQLAVQCADGDPITYSEEGFAQTLAGLQNGSPTLAPMWANMWLECADWKLRAKWNFTERFEAATTSHPILAVSSRYDPVTPLAHARHVYQRFGGAALLIQEGHGHCSSSAPSLCTAKYIREYFVNGTLPAQGTKCEVDELPFLGRKETVRALSSEDEELFDALQGMAANMPVWNRR